MADGDRAGHKHLGLCEAGRNIASRAGQRNSQTIGRKKKSEYLAQRRKGRQVRKSKKKFFLAPWCDQFSNSALGSQPE